MFQGMEYVYAVYLEKSFSKAAEKLFISQPSLSANVKRVEQHIGYPIFDRSTKPLSLTECGLQYIRSVEKIKSIQNEFEDYINDWGDLKKGTLKLGGSNLFSSWILPPLIAEFARTYPLIQISLLEETTANLARMIRHGQLDLMLDSSELDETIYDSCKYREEHLILAVPGSFKINQKLVSYQLPVKDILNKNFLKDAFLPVPLSCFQDEPFIMLKPENDTGKRARLLCQESNFEPNVILEMDQQMTSYNITCSGMGISFIGDIMLSKIPLHSNVIYYKLPPCESKRNICFYWKKGRYKTRAIEEFLKMACL